MHMCNALLLLPYTHAHSYKLTHAHAQKFLATRTHTHTNTLTPSYTNAHVYFDLYSDTVSTKHTHMEMRASFWGGQSPERLARTGWSAGTRRTCRVRATVYCASVFLSLFSCCQKKFVCWPGLDPVTGKRAMFWAAQSLRRLANIRWCVWRLLLLLLVKK